MPKQSIPMFWNTYHATAACPKENNAGIFLQTHFRTVLIYYYLRWGAIITISNQYYHTVLLFHIAQHMN